MADTKLTDKQRRFVNAWVSNGQNGTAAARAAGYKGHEKTLRVAASRLLTLDSVQAAISDLTGKAMAKAERGAVASLQECLEGLSAIRRAKAHDYLTAGEFDPLKLANAPEGLFRITPKGIEQESSADAARALIKYHGERVGAGQVQGTLARVLQSLPDEVVGAIARGMLSGNGHGALPISVKATVVK